MLYPTCLIVLQLLECTTIDGLTPLIYSAKLGKVEFCVELIKRGAKVNAKEQVGVK